MSDDNNNNNDDQKLFKVETSFTTTIRGEGVIAASDEEDAAQKTLDYYADSEDITDAEVHSVEEISDEEVAEVFGVADDLDEPTLH